MSRDVDATYRALADAGWSREEVDQHLRVNDHSHRVVDDRVVRSAMQLDLIDARVEQARLDAFKENVERLQRLGFDVSELRPPPAPHPSERHLARAFTSADEPTRYGTDKRGLLIRPNTGHIIAVR